MKKNMNKLPRFPCESSTTNKEMEKSLWEKLKLLIFVPILFDVGAAVKQFNNVKILVKILSLKMCFPSKCVFSVSSLNDFDDEWNNQCLDNL